MASRPSIDHPRRANRAQRPAVGKLEERSRPCSAATPPEPEAGTPWFRTGQLDPAKGRTATATAATTAVPAKRQEESKRL
jgi:hypothetical protein